MSRPQNLSNWEQLNDIQLPEIGGEEVTLLIGANVPEAQIHEEVRVGGVGEPYAVRTLLGCHANDKMKAYCERTREKLINRKPETRFKVLVLIV